MRKELFWYHFSVSKSAYLENLLTCKVSSDQVEHLDRFFSKPSWNKIKSPCKLILCMQFFHLVDLLLVRGIRKC